MGYNADGRHYHLDMTSIPFILGSSTSPSHNVKSNVQKVGIKDYEEQKSIQNKIIEFNQ